MYIPFRKILLPVSALFLTLPFCAHAANVDGYNYVVGDRLEQALDLPIPYFRLDANDALRFADDLRYMAGIALCLELKPMFPVAPPLGETEEEPVAEVEPLELENTTPRRILDAFTRVRPDYTWLHVGGNRVNLLPTAQVNDPDWRGHLPTGTWEVSQSDIGAYFKKLISFTFNTEQPLSTTTEIQQVQPLWAKHPQLLHNRKASILNREATLLEALDAVAAFGADVVWTLNGPYYQYEVIPLDEVYPTAFQQAEAYRKQPDAEQATALALYQMAFEEAPYADLKIRVGMAIMEVYLGRSMENATPQPEMAAQMCRLLLDAKPKYPYDATLWQQYITLLYSLGKESDAQWAVRALCMPGASPDSYPCVQAKQLVLWIASLYEKPEDKIRYLISKQNVFPDDAYFNDELDARVYAIQAGIQYENMPEHNPYAQFNQPPVEDEAKAVEEEPGIQDTRYRHTPRRVKR